MSQIAVTLRAAQEELRAAHQEIARLRTELVRARSEQRLTAALYAELLAGCRAAVAAARAGELDPLSYVVGPLEEHGQLPPEGMSPSVLLAVGYRVGGAE